MLSTPIREISSNLTCIAGRARKIKSARGADPTQTDFVPHDQLGVDHCEHTVTVNVYFLPASSAIYQRQPIVPASRTDADALRSASRRPALRIPKQDKPLFGRQKAALIKHTLCPIVACVNAKRDGNLARPAEREVVPLSIVRHSNRGRGECL